MHTDPEVYTSKNLLKVIDVIDVHVSAKLRICRLLTLYNAKLSYFNFHPLETVSRYRDPQLQAGENYTYNLFV